MDDDALLNAHQVANRLKLPLAWVRRAADRGDLPALIVRQGRRPRYLFNLEAVKSALAQLAAKGTHVLAEDEDATTARPPAGEEGGS